LRPPRYSGIDLFLSELAEINPFVRWRDKLRREDRFVLLALTVLLNAWFALSMSQAGPTHPKVISLPQGELSHIPSPDGKWILTFECPHECRERKLWIEDNSVHTRRFIRDYERDLRISWAPDSRHFFVDDASGSDEESCSVYEPSTLKSTDIALVLLAANADADRFLKAGHSYLRATQWIDSHELIVVLFGHFDDAPAGGFTLRYRMNLNGDVHMLSRKQSEEAPR